MLKIIAFFIITLFTRLYMKVGIIPTCIDNFHDRIISLRREVWVHKNSLAPPLYTVRKVSGHVLVLRVSIYFDSFYNFDI